MHFQVDVALPISLIDKLRQLVKVKCSVEEQGKEGKESKEGKVGKVVKTCVLANKNLRI